MELKIKVVPFYSSIELCFIVWSVCTCILRVPTDHNRERASSQPMVTITDLFHITMTYDLRSQRSNESLQCSVAHKMAQTNFI